MIKKNKIPTILGIFVLLIGTIAGVFLLNKAQVFKIGADASLAPKDVRISNITDTSVTITWVTDKETTSFVNWGKSKTAINSVENESGSQEKFITHSINLSGLDPNSTYYFLINNSGSSFDNNGVPWEFATGDVLSLDNGSHLVAGSVIATSGKAEKRALVYLNVNGYLMSTLTSNSGSYVFQLANARSSDLGTYSAINSSQTLLDISVNAGPNGVSSAQIFPQSAHSIPTIIIGQIYDFRGLEPSSVNEGPIANLNLPESTDKESRFSVPTDLGTPKPPVSVILENLVQGETVTSTKPSFFGKGPGGTEITITIESDPITQVLTIPQNGSWTFNTPSNLSEGAHTITISWKDSTGITRTLVRNFIVQAGEVPSFEASPSQSLSTTTPSPSSTPTATQSPTAAPTLTPTTTPTLTPSAVPSPTETPLAENLPVTGGLTPTLLLSIMGIAVLALSILLWTASES